MEQKTLEIEIIVSAYETRYTLTEKGREYMASRNRHVFTTEQRKKGGKARAAKPDWPECQRKGYEAMLEAVGPELTHRIIGRARNKREGKTGKGYYTKEGAA